MNGLAAGFCLAVAFIFMYNAQVQLEVLKEIRNEVQTVHMTIADSFECVPLLLNDQAEMKINPKGKE